MSEHPIVLVDGSSFLFRAYHALDVSKFMTGSGQPTNAVFGFANMLRRLADLYPQSPMMMVMDAPGGSFRNDIDPEYKANRAAMPDELRSQIPLVHELVQAMGLPLVVESGVEADDVIGTLSARLDAQGHTVVIATGDKDLAQLVNERVTLIDTMRDESKWLMDAAGVVEKFGVPPERIIDYLALIGDSSDNIKGVRGVGPKTALKWLQSYHTLDGILEHADEIKGKIGETLRESREIVALARNLVTIRRDLELDADTESLAIADPDHERLRDLAERLEFRTWLRQLEGDAAEDVATDQLDASYVCIDDEAELAAWVLRLKAAGRFAVDCETTSLDPHQAALVGISLSADDGEAAYIPIGHLDIGGLVASQLPLSVVQAQLQPLFADRSIGKIGQNIKYDALVLARHALALAGISDDTMLMSYVHDAQRRHDMDSLAKRWFGHQMISYDSVTGTGKKRVTFDQVEIAVATDYAAEDALVTWRLANELQPALLERGVDAVYREIEMPLLPVLIRVEQNGIRIDPETLAIQSEELSAKAMELEAKAHELAGKPFNLASPKQIQAIFFDELGLPVLEKTPKGAPSTAESVLERLAEDFELPRVILDHRSLTKLRSTYTEKLPRMINPHTGRVHTSFNQAVASTGRLSSTDPNLQNIPIRTAEGRRIRNAFIADQGHVLLAADYSQIELRIMAHLSDDEGLLRAFRDGKDIHSATAAEIFDTPLDAVDSDQRRSAKAINFGLIYGMSAFGLARQLGLPRNEAQDYIDRYFARYPGVHAYMEKQRELAHEQGFVETLFGRRLYLPEINDRNYQRRQYAERTAINAPMQGTAADIIKRAMIDIDAWLEQSSVPARMVLQVHDELVFEIAEHALDDCRGEIVERMSAAASLKVPLLVEVGSGDNWGEAH
ncbi:DNA polymerase I [Gammaproteobacteria bacterium]|nr:DNA polymerase I [Gammaproteobacteria bacterium]